jgi:hypothetical protein
MESFDTQPPLRLTDEKMAILVAIVLEEFGVRLTRIEVNKLLALFEHLP